MSDAIPTTVALGDSVYISAIALIGSILTPVVGVALTYIIKKLNLMSVENAAAAKVGEETHRLANGQMTYQLGLTAKAMRRIAAMSKDPADEAIAVMAEKAFAEHVAKQKVLDEWSQAIAHAPIEGK